jgi:hypothetical protein
MYGGCGGCLIREADLSSQHLYRQTTHRGLSPLIAALFHLTEAKSKSLKLWSTSSIDDLCLVQINVEKKSCVAMRSLLQSSACALRRLSLRFSKKFINIALRSLSNGLATNTSLKTFKVVFDASNAETMSISIVLDGLANNTTIKTLNLTSRNATLGRSTPTSVSADCFRSLSNLLSSSRSKLKHQTVWSCSREA